MFFSKQTYWRLKCDTILFSRARLIVSEQNDFGKSCRALIFKLVLKGSQHIELYWIILLYLRGLKAVLKLIKRNKVLSQTIMIYDHEKVPQIYPYGWQNLSKITAFSQEILVKDVCVRRKSTIKSHPAWHEQTKHNPTLTPWPILHLPRQRFGEYNFDPTNLGRTGGQADRHR